MARLSILAISLGLVLLIATTTSAYRTTVTTVEIDSESNQSGQSRQRCQQQLQHQSLNNCNQYVRQEARQQGGEDNRPEQQRDQCCQELRQIQDDECQCQALEQILQRQLQQGEIRGHQVQRVAQQLQNLPQRCGSGSQRCQFQVSVSSY